MKTCRRGHNLTEPNLVAGDLTRGVRRCRSCSLARDAGRRSKRAGRPWTDDDAAAYADAKYADLMPTEVEEREQEQERQTVSTCPHGHRLTPENLDAANLRRGRKRCRACHMAASIKRRHPDWSEAETRAYADSAYARIADGTAVAGHAEKEVCKRGHPLRDGNLRPGMLKRGIRACRACNAADAAARRNNWTIAERDADADRRAAQYLDQGA